MGSPVHLEVGVGVSGLGGRKNEITSSVGRREGMKREEGKTTMEEKWGGSPWKHRRLG